MTYRICFVCAGNICRSPTAEGVMRSQLAAHGLATAVEVDSAGTGHWHVGEEPDPRAQAAATRRGIDLVHRARQLVRADLDRFDLLLAMDRANLRGIAGIVRAPAGADKVRLLRSFDPASPAGAEVPDPYYGDAAGFDHVLDVCEAACRGLVVHVRAVLGG